MDHLILARKPNLMLIKKEKKRTYHLIDIAVLEDLKVKVKGNKKIDKYLDLARELKRQCKT